MSQRDRIMRDAQRTAGEAREAAKRGREAQRKDRAKRSFSTSAHRHCSVCWAPIPLAEDPAVCSNPERAEKQRKRESSRKRWTVMLYLFPAIAILLVFLQGIGASG